MLLGGLLADHLLVNLPPWVSATRTVDDWQTSAWDHFAEWSPAKLDEITHILATHKKKVALRPGDSYPPASKVNPAPSMAMDERLLEER